MDNSDKDYSRGSLRLPVSMRGSISDGRRTSRCLVQDMSDSGLLIVCTELFAVGTILNLDCESVNGKSLSCKVRVVRHDDSAMGVAIIEISVQSSDGFLLETEAGRCA